MTSLRKIPKPTPGKMWSETIGSGEDLVLVHGMGAAHTAWQLIAPELSKSFRVTIIDLPGHGNTPFDPNQNMEPEALAQLVINQMNEIGINQFHVAGNSLGGWIVLEMAAMNPEQIKSVTALAPAGLWLTPFWTRTPFAAASKYLASGLKIVAPNLLKYEWARKMGFSLVSPLWPQFSYQLCLDATLAMGKSQGYFPAWDGFLTKRFDKKISPELPITIVFGDTDNSLPADTCQERILAPAHVRWVVLPETGHTPMWDHPHEVIAEIRATAGVLT